MPLSKRYFALRAQGSAGDAPEIDMFDQIGPYNISAKFVKTALDSVVNAYGEKQKIRINLNSPGGEIMEGYAIYGLLMEYKGEIDIHVYGWAASMATVIAMTGSKITMHEGAWMMIHEPWMFTMGNEDQLRKDADMLAKMKADIYETYIARTGKSESEIKQIMKEETWYNSEEAVANGFADIRISDKDPRNTIDMSYSQMKIPEKVARAFTQSPIPKGATMKTCPKCGKEVENAFDFCPHCSASMKLDTSKAHEKEVNEAKAEERARVSGILDRCTKMNLSATVAQNLIASGKTLAECAVAILDIVEKKNPQDFAPVAPAVHVTRDDSDKFRMAAKNAICVSAGLERDSKIVAEATGSGAPSSAHTLVKTCLLREGVMSPNAVANLSAEGVAREACRLMSGANISSTDLANILADVANKSVQVGLTEEQTTFQLWTASGEAKDFKNINMVSTSNFGDMLEIKDGEAFQGGKIADKKETAALKTYGRTATLTRKDLINDDMSALTEFPRLMTRAHFRAINCAVYDALTSASLTGPLMSEDGVRLFNDAGHGNLKTTSGVPSLTSLGVARRKLREIPMLNPDKGAKAQPTGSIARYIITGTANETAIDNLIAVPNNVLVSNATTSNPYSQQGGRTPLVPVIDAYLGSLLDAASAEYAWYLAGDQNFIPTFKVFYLQGNRVPTFRSAPSSVSEALGISYDTFFDWCVGLQDWRNLVFNDGK